MIINQKLCWIICDDGKIGTEHQCVGLAHSLGYHPEIIRVRARGFWRFLPPSLWMFPLKGVTTTDKNLTPPWPEIIISAGRLSVAPTSKIRKITQGQTKVIQLLNPRIHPRHFDLVIAPEHDNLTGVNVLQTQGALHLLTQAHLEAEGARISHHIDQKQKPLIAVLIGGRNPSYAMKTDEIYHMAQRLKKILDRYQAQLMITFSRRTPAEMRQIFHETLKETSALVWNLKEDNPYYGFLNLADYIIVTCDSISMTSEACFTGKPVYVYFFKGGSRKFNRFHQLFQARNYTKPFEDQLEFWTYPPLNELSRMADMVRQRLRIERQ